MIADPDISQTVKVTIDGIEWEYAREVCDAPEDDRFGLRVGGHLASNAVTPACPPVMHKWKSTRPLRSICFTHTL